MSSEVRDPDPARFWKVALLVEDNPEVASVTQAMFEYLGWLVTSAPSPEAALSLLHDVDLLFSDVMMPGGMTGFELAVAARRIRSDLPIVLTSGYVELVRREAATTGIPLLPKPYSLDQLSNAILDAQIRAEN